jgi:hypothetical protein
MRAGERRRQFGRPLDRRQRVRRGIEPPQLRRVEHPAVGDVHRADQRGNLRAGLPSRVRVGQSRGRIRVELIAPDMEGDVGARELGVELLRELGRTRAKACAHPLALRFAHFAQPAVLQRREDREQHEQQRRRQQLPRGSAHERTVREKGGRRPALYISYKTIAER